MRESPVPGERRCLPSQHLAFSGQQPALECPATWSSSTPTMSALAISPDGRQLRVPSKKDNTARGLFRDGQALDFEIDRPHHPCPTSTSSRTAENLALRVDLNDRDRRSALGLSAPWATTVFVATQAPNTVEVRAPTTTG